MARGQTYQSLFNYGETGYSLDGFRDSEISKQSANKLVNFYISDMGTLQIAKQFVDFDLKELLEEKIGEPILAVKVTKYKFILAITKHKIYPIGKNLWQKTDKKWKPLTVSFDFSNTNGRSPEKDYFDEYCNSNIFQNFLFIKLVSGRPLVFYYNEHGAISETSYFSQLKLPFKESKPVVVDIYKVYKKTDSSGTKLIPNYMITYDNNMGLKLSNDGKIKLAGTEEIVDRLYLSFKASITDEMIDGLRENMIFAVFRHFYPENQSLDLGYYINEFKVRFGSQTFDKKFNGKYVTQLYIDSSNEFFGDLTYGQKDNFRNNLANIIDICDFQSRVCVATKEKLYFSKIFDATDFTTGLQADSGLYIKPSTIEGNQADIMKLVSGNGVYVLSTEGIYVCNYGQTITPTSQNVRVASTNKPLPCCVLIDDVLYYLDMSGVLRGLIPNFENGFVQFTNTIIDKYNNEKFNYSFLTKCTLNNRNVLVVTLRKPTQEMIVYEYIGENIFRRTTLELKATAIGLIHGVGENLIIGTHWHVLSEFNMTHAKIQLNLPFIQTDIGGTYLNDFQQEYSKIVLNVLNIENKYVEGITINKFPIQNIAYGIGNYNIYKWEGTLSIMDLVIDIYLKNQTDNGIRGDETVELRGINCWLK